MTEGVSQVFSRGLVFDTNVLASPQAKHIADGDKGREL